MRSRGNVIMLGTYIYVNLKSPYRLTHLIIILWKVLLAVYKLLCQLTSQDALSTLHNPAVSPAVSTTCTLKKAHHVATPRSLSHTHHSHDHTLQRSDPAFALKLTEAGSAWLAAACPGRSFLDRTLQLWLASQPVHALRGVCYLRLSC